MVLKKEARNLVFLSLSLSYNDISKNGTNNVVIQGPSFFSIKKKFTLYMIKLIERVTGSFHRGLILGNFIVSL